MLETFTSFNVLTDKNADVTIHGIKGGSGPPLLLIHGAPQTHHTWHRVAPLLTSRYTIVAVDLRGYGASSKPPHTHDHVAYSKSAMAFDCVAVMEALGFQRFFVCGHDRGARVTHQLCIDYPNTVIKAILLDICPTVAMYSNVSGGVATAYWHWFFLIQPYPLPETLLSRDHGKWLSMFMGAFKNGSGPSDIFTAAAFEEYRKAAESNGAVAGMCEDYRASATVDLEQQRNDIRDGKKIQCELYVLWGKEGLLAKNFDVLKEWQQVCAKTVRGQAIESGHFMPEEVPDLIVQEMQCFLV
ncbi:putative hydrolase or acyltransferase of alpha/beta superfamily [Ilyonectria robusta]|uniref:putative hydrolase or acyltransferase of alpha/beta superfamily n=1 Tax=Ilyonectria robusta TaxID=1079257 RepID=UPI001E8DEE7C|nr:putative hydrolase or acyltransferase of alpha/beta superfamily [Ilyonectria robusta]KAH8649577.1 putative hydrolase or acyltransferase of alpha/beta superfamily [Ilyonectria robusta]